MKSSKAGGYAALEALSSKFHPLIPLKSIFHYS